MFYLRSNEGKTLEEIEEEIQRKELLEQQALETQRREKLIAQQALAADVGAVAAAPVTRPPRTVAAINPRRRDVWAAPTVVSDSVLTQPGSLGGSRRMPSTPAFVSGARNIDPTPFVPQPMVDDYSEFSTPEALHAESLSKSIASRQLGLGGKPFPEREIVAGQHIPQGNWATDASKKFVKKIGMVAADYYGGLGKFFRSPNLAEFADTEDLGPVARAIGPVDIARNTAESVQFMGDSFNEMQSIIQNAIANGSLDTEVIGTWDDVKKAEGILATALETLKYTAEETPGVLAYMSAILTAAPLTFVSEINRQAEQRARNKNLEPRMYTAGDVAAVIGTAWFNVYVEKAFLKQVLPGLKNKLSPSTLDSVLKYLKTPARRIVTAGGVGTVGQPIIEFMQGSAEHASTTIGTKKQFTVDDALDAGLAEAVAGIFIGPTIGAGGQVVKEVQKSKADKFNALKAAAGSGTKITDPAIAASENEILGYIKKKYPDVVINPNVRRRIVIDEEGNERVARDEAIYETPTGDIVVSPKSVILGSNSMADVRSRLDSVLGRHERFHQIMAEYRTRGGMEEDPVGEFRDAHRGDIFAWFSQMPEYKSLYEDKLNSEDPAVVAAAELAITEEFINANGEGDTGIANEIKLFLLNLGAELGVKKITPETEARLLLRKVLNANRKRNPATAREIEAKDELAAFLEEQAAAEPVVKKRVPQTWAQLGSDVLRPMMEANRAKDNPIWQAQYKELERRGEPYTGSPHRYTPPVFPGMEEIDPDGDPDIEDYDQDLPEASTDLEGARAETENVYRAIDKTVGDIENYVVSMVKTAGELDAHATAAEMTDAQRTTRDANNWVAKQGLKMMETDAQRQQLKIVQKLWGQPLHKLMGKFPGTLTEFKKITRAIRDGDTQYVENAIGSYLEEVNAAKEARAAVVKEEKRTKALEKVGKSEARRNRTRVKSYEKLLTPNLTQNILQRRLDNGDITQEQFDEATKKVQEIQETVFTTAQQRKQFGNLLGDEYVDTEADIAWIEEQSVFLARDKKVPVDDQTMPTEKTTTKAERKSEQDAALAKFYEEGGEATTLPAATDAEVEKIRAQNDAAFAKGVSKRRKGVWAAEGADILAEVEEDADILYDEVVESELKTEQGEAVDGFEELQSTVLDKPEKLRINYKGKVVEVIRDYKIKHEDDTTTTMWVVQDGEGNFLAISEDPTLVTTDPVKDTARGSAKWKEWISGHEVYGKPPYFKDGKANVKALAKVYEDVRTAAYFDGVDVNIDIIREYAKNMSPTSLLMGEREALTKGLNKIASERDTHHGPRWMDNDHVVELTAPKKQENYPIRYETGPRDVHHPENYITVDKIMHDAVNHFLRLHPHLKKDSEKYTKMITFMNNGSSEAEKFAAHYAGYDLKGYLAKLKNMPKGLTLTEQQLYLLNASEALRGETLTQSKDFEPVTVNNPEALARTAIEAYPLMSTKLDPKQDYDTRQIVADRTSSTLGMFLKYVYGAPVRRISDFNKPSAIGVGDHGTITMATEIANLVQKSLSSKDRPEGKEHGTDLVQEVSLRSGEFYSRLFKVFAGVTNNAGVIPPGINAQIVDYIAGKPVEFTNKKIETAAKELKTFMEDMYKYAKDRTAGLKTPLDLRGAGDTVLPRVWNIDYIATKAGKSRFLKAIASKFTDPKGDLILEGANITPEDLYAVVINSGGFVQGEWTNVKADQTTSKAEIEKDQLIQEYLDSLSTEELADAGLLVDDLQSVIPRFVQKAIERTEYSAVFGVNDELLRGMVQVGVDQIKAHNALVMKMEEGGPNNLIDPKAFQNAVWDMSKILRNKFGYEMADMPTRKWTQRVANVEVVAKLPLVTLASMPEFFTPMLKGDVRPDKFAVDFALASAWAGYKGMNGLSKLIFNKHLPAMLKHSSEIGGTGIISDIQLLRESGIFDIQSMGDTVATRYSNPNFARGGIRATTRGTVGGKIPKNVRAVFNMQTYMQATMLTTMTEMQQFMALRNYQRHMMTRVKFIKDNKGKKLTGRKANKLKQYKQDMSDYGLAGDIDLDTAEGQSAFTAGALRFIDQVVTRPNDATTAKIFKNPLTSPLVLFKRFITTYGNTLLTSVGADFATKVDNVERAKQVGKLSVATASMYGAVVFAEILRGAIKGTLDEDDLKVRPEDWKTFMRRVDRMGVLSAPGSAAAAMTFPSQAWYGDTGTNRMVRELTGPFGSDMAGVLDFLMSKKGEKDLRKLLGQISPTTRYVFPGQSKRKSNYKKKSSGKSYADSFK